MHPKLAFEEVGREVSGHRRRPSPTATAEPRIQPGLARRVTHQELVAWPVARIRVQVVQGLVAPGSGEVVAAVCVVWTCGSDLRRRRRADPRRSKETNRLHGRGRSASAL